MEIDTRKEHFLIVKSIVNVSKASKNKKARMTIVITDDIADMVIQTLLEKKCRDGMPKILMMSLNYIENTTDKTE